MESQQNNFEWQNYPSNKPVDEKADYTVLCHSIYRPQGGNAPLLPYTAVWLGDRFIPYAHSEYFRDQEVEFFIELPNRPQKSEVFNG